MLLNKSVFVNLISLIGMGTACLGLTSKAHSQTLIYVDRSQTVNNEDGLTWDTAFDTVQEGIDAAFETGINEVWIANGLYDEARTIEDDNGFPGSVILRDGVSILGGFKGNESELSQRDASSFLTIVDGSKSRNGEAAYHVILAVGVYNTGVLVDGLSIRGGRAIENDSSQGGGLRGAENVNVRNCEFRDNFALGTSGALASGGLVEDCVFIGNSSVNAGAMSIGASPMILRCYFEDNRGAFGTSALSVSSVVESLVKDCIFVRNRSTAGTNSAALTCSGDVRVENCLFVDNSAVGSGSAGAIFHGGSLEPNSAVPATRGVYVNCTFVGNSSPGGSVLRFGQVKIHFDNCIVWGNSDPWFAKSAPISPAWIFNCVLQSDSTDIFDEAIGDNIFADPLFVNPTGQDFRLRPESPAIDMGHAMRTTPPTQIDAGFVVIPPDDDMDGNPRPLGTGFDIGAYEFDPAVSFEDPFDPTGDQMSDAADLQHVINQVLGTTSPITDLNNDGQTDAADIQLMTNWLLGII